MEVKALKKCLDEVCDMLDTYGGRDKVNRLTNSPVKSFDLTGTGIHFINNDNFCIKSIELNFIFTRIISVCFHFLLRKL